MQKRVLGEEVCVLKIEPNRGYWAAMRGRMPLWSFPVVSCESLFKDQIREKGCDDGQRSQEKMCGDGWLVQRISRCVLLYVGGA